MRSAGSHLAPARVAAKRHERGFRHDLSADKGEGKLLMLGVEGGMVDAPSRWRGLGTAADRLGTDRRLVPPEADGNRAQDDDAPT